MDDPKKILVVINNKEQNKRIVNGLRYLLDEMNANADVLSAYTFERGLLLAKEFDIKTFVIGLGISDEKSAIEFVIELRSIGYAYNGVILVAEKLKCSYQEIHELTKFSRMRMYPFEMSELAEAVFYELNAPDHPKDEYLPTIKSNVTFQLSRSKTLVIKKMKHKNRIAVYFKSDDPYKPIRKEYPIDSFDKVLETLLPESEKQFKRCERTIIINTYDIEEVHKTKHYVRVTGYPDDISVGPKFRGTIYDLFD